MASLRVYFGSQTGTAEGFAQELVDEASAHGFEAQAKDLDEFDAGEFARPGLVFVVVATYGEGQPTESAEKIVEWLEKGGAPGALDGMRFAVMGLGDSTYEQFNAMGKLVDTELARLGGSRVYTRGIGDDSKDIVEDFARWREGLWIALTKETEQDLVQPSKRRRTDSAERETASPDSEPRRVSEQAGVEGAGDRDAELDDDDDDDSYPFVKSEATSGTCAPRSATVARWLRGASEVVVTACKDLDHELGEHSILESASVRARHVEIDVSELAQAESWEAGWTLELLPRSDPADAAWFADRMLPAPVVGAREPKRDTLLQELSACDLLALPSASTLRRLAGAIDDRASARRVLDIAGNEPFLRGLATSPTKLTLRELFALVLAPSARLQAEEFVRHCPRLVAREYTVAAARANGPPVVAIAVALLREQLQPLHLDVIPALSRRGFLPAEAANAGGFTDVGPRILLGACSAQLVLRCRAGDRMMARLRPSPLRPPVALADGSRPPPVVMVAAGAGVAPFRGFVQEWRRVAVGSRGRAVLFFGCRARASYAPYMEEFRAALGEGGAPPPLCHLFCAYSRDSGRKEYVQLRIAEEQRLLQELWREGAHFYVCGAVAMGKSVRDAIADALAPNAGGRNVVEELRRCGRFIEELWG